MYLRFLSNLTKSRERERNIYPGIPGILKSVIQNNGAISAFCRNFLALQKQQICKFMDVVVHSRLVCKIEARFDSGNFPNPYRML